MTFTPLKYNIEPAFARYLSARLTALLLLLFISAGSLRAMKEQKKASIIRQIERADSLYSRQQYIKALDVYISLLSYPHRNDADSLYLILLSRIGTVYDIYEDYGRAFYYYEKVLGDANVTRYEDIYSKVLVKMVVGSYNSGEPDKARRYYRQQLAHPIKDKQMSGYYHYTNGALVECLDGRYDRAIAMFRRALSHCDAQGMQPVFKVPLMLEMAGVFRNLNMPDSSLLYLERAREIAERDNLDSYAADCYHNLYRHYKDAGEPEKAASFLELYSTASDSADMHRKLDTASLRLLQSHDVQAREEINSLNDRIDMQVKTLLLILTFCVLLAMLVIYMRIQHRRLKASYRLLIEKSDEIFELEQHTAEQAGAAEAPAPTAETPNPLLERINAALNDISLISRPSFSLADLSREVGSNTKYVSQVVNEVYKKNFRTILNERRIREATRRLSDPDRYGDCSIAEIAESLGYSSSTVFINAFKKVIGMTPAVYRRYRK